MAKTDKKTAPEIAGDDFVRLYLGLKQQVRDPKDTLSAFTVLKAEFFPHAA